MHYSILSEVHQRLSGLGSGKEETNFTYYRFKLVTLPGLNIYSRNTEILFGIAFRNQYLPPKKKYQSLPCGHISVLN